VDDERIDWRSALRDPRVLALLACMLLACAFAGYKMANAFGGQGQHAPDLPAPAFINHTITPLVDTGALNRSRLPEAAYRQAVSQARAVTGSLFKGAATPASLRAAGVPASETAAALTQLAGQKKGASALRDGFALQEISANRATLAADFVSVSSGNAPLYGRLVMIFASSDAWKSARLIDLRVQMQAS